MKKILAIACYSASCAAFAQSSVTVTGVVDAFGGRLRNAGDPAGINVVNGGGLSTSWIGFLASEDLAEALRATVNLTSFFSADNGASARLYRHPLFQRD